MEIKMKYLRAKNETFFHLFQHNQSKLRHRINLFIHNTCIVNRRVSVKDENDKNQYYDDESYPNEGTNDNNDNNDDDVSGVYYYYWVLLMIQAIIKRNTIITTMIWGW